MRVHLDTHAVVELHGGRVRSFGAASRRLLESEDLTWSPVVALELALLFEIGRLRYSPAEILGQVAVSTGATETDDSLGAIVRYALPLGWTRDPFDRLITAHAAMYEAPLVTRDEHIGRHYPRAVW